MVRHDMAEQGVPLTVEKLNEVYRSLHVRYYGDTLVLDDDVEVGWMRIPHFYQGFYVYKYATGFSAAQSFLKKILTGGTSAVAQYLELLKSGGKDYPLLLLKTAGVDMTTPKPVRDALGVFESIISELEELL